MIPAILAFVLFASAAAACTPTVMIPSGLALLSPPGVLIEYALHDSTIEFAVKAPAAEVVAISIVKKGQASQSPGDAVFGFSNGTIQQWQINGPTFQEWMPSGIPLANATARNGTSLSFTRSFNSGRFHIDPKDLSFDVFYGKNLTDVSTARVVANLVAGESARCLPSSPPWSRGPVSAADALGFSAILTLLIACSLGHLH